MRLTRPARFIWCSPSPSLPPPSPECIFATRLSLTRLFTALLAWASFCVGSYSFATFLLDCESTAITFKSTALVYLQAEKKERMASKVPVSRPGLPCSWTLS